MEKQKTVLVTGGARGIGEAIVRRYAKEGYRVLVNYNQSCENAVYLQKELIETGARVKIFRADVSKRNEVVSMVESIEQNGGSVDILINNAGVAHSAVFDTITEEEWDNVMNINLKGTFLCSQAVLPGMLRKKYGCIINISSIWGLVGASTEVHYSTAKAGIIGMTKALAKEVAISGIRVNCVAPGLIQTDMVRDLSIQDLEAFRKETPMQRIGCVDDISNAVFFLSSDEASFITGQVLSPNGGVVL